MDIQGCYFCIMGDQRLNVVTKIIHVCTSVPTSQGNRREFPHLQISPRLIISNHVLR